MKKARISREVVQLNGAAFRLSSEGVRAGNLDALVDQALARVLGGQDEGLSCVQYTCSLFMNG